MPAPTILPPIDWPGIFEGGRDYEAWLAAGKTPGSAEAMRTLVEELVFEPQVSAFLAALERDVHVIAIAEDWCPDVIRHVPVLQKMADTTPRVKVSYIGRKSNPEVLVRHLTTGGESIPKFIFFNHEFVECGSWGPMPQVCREMIARGRAAGDIAGARNNIASLYNADPTRRIVVDEFIKLIDIASTKVP